MGKIEIEVPDGYEVKVVKKEENKFKDGDVLYVKCKSSGSKYIFIYKNGDYKTSCHCCILVGDSKIYYRDYVCHDQNIVDIGKANELEKGIIISHLKLVKKFDMLKKFFNIDLEPEIKTYQDLIDNSVRINTAYLITRNSFIIKIDSFTINSEEDKNVAKSEKVAKSMLAMAQISQLIPYYGGEVTDEEWDDNTIHKYCIKRYKKSIGIYDACHDWDRHTFLAFHTNSQCNEFLKNNEQLVKDYLMIE